METNQKGEPESSLGDFFLLMLLFIVPGGLIFLLVVMLFRALTREKPDNCYPPYRAGAPDTHCWHNEPPSPPGADTCCQCKDTRPTEYHGDTYHDDARKQ